MARRLFNFALLILMVYFESFHQTSSAESVSVVVAPFAPTSRGRTENISKQCEELGFCEESMHYPTVLAGRLSEKIEQENLILNRDSLNNEGYPIISNRFGTEKSNPCATVKRIVIPELVRHLNGSWLYAVNLKQKPLQRYNVEICVPKTTTGRHKKECGSLTLEDRYTAKCVQKFVTRSIVVMGASEPATIPFSIPCCCTCVAVPNN